MPRHSRRMYSESMSSSKEELSAQDYMAPVPKYEPSCWDNLRNHVLSKLFAFLLFNRWGTVTLSAVSFCLFVWGLDIYQTEGNSVILITGGVFTGGWVITLVIMWFMYAYFAGRGLRVLG